MSNPDNSNKKPFFKNLWALLKIIFIFYIIASCGQILDSTSQEQETLRQEQETLKSLPTINITAYELYNDYDSNQISAEGKYKGRVLEVSGVLKDIGVAILDEPYITLKTKDRYSSVQCVLRESQKNRAASLQKGESLSVKGINTGKTISNVMLDDCIII